MRRVGSVKERRVRVRLVAATNKDLLEEVQHKRFREDLFYRINVLTLQLPPLREREGDLQLLLGHFAGPHWRFDPDVMKALQQYSWPGNVRQLQNAIERAKILADDERIRVKNLPAEILVACRGRSKRTTIGEIDLFSYTRRHILETYHRHHSNKSETARALGVSRRTLYRLLAKYGEPASCSN